MRQKVFMDLEFAEAPNQIEIISLGMAKLSGETLYLVFDFDKTKPSPWVNENVIPNIGIESDGLQYTREQAKQKILEFLGNTKEVQICGYYCDYDWVAFCWLFGSMINLPKGLPMYCWDLKQFLDDNNIPRELQPNNPIPHHALYDAIQERDYYIAAHKHLLDKT